MIMQQMSIKPRSNKLVFFVTILFLVIAPVLTSNSADLQESIDTKVEQEVYLFKGDLVGLKVYSLTRLAISNPDIVDVANADVNEILIVGQKVGTTQIFIWDELGKRQVIASVLKEDLDLIVARLQKLFQQAGIENINIQKNNYEGKVILSGKVPSGKYAQYKLMADTFSENTIDLVTEDVNKELIQIDVQVTELSTTLTKEMGIDWTAGGSGLTFSYPETLPEELTGIENLFKIGEFGRTNALLATVSFLIAEGKARVLSKPSIVVTNGQSASLLVGGDIPIRTTSTSTGGSSVQENVSFKSYGINLTVTPTLREEKIELVITITVTDIDASNAVGEDVAFTNRTTNTNLLLNDNQTIVIAGLIKQNRSESINRVPFLSKIPIAGMLFRNKSSPNADLDQEMVISITPKVYKEDTAKEAEAAKAKNQDKAAAESAIVSESGSDVKPAEATMTEGEDDARDKALEDAMSAEESEEENSFLETEAVDDLGLEIEAEDTAKTTMPADKTLEDKLDVDMNEDAAGEIKEDSLNMEESQADELTELPEPSPAVTDDDQLPEKTIATYVQTVQKMIADAVSFPYEAREKGWEGTVLLTLTILSDGTLQDIEVKKSSGYNVFDNDAKNTAQILSPFDPFPSDLDLEEISVSLPIVYSQKMLTQ